MLLQLHVVNTSSLSSHETEFSYQAATKQDTICLHMQQLDCNK